jgi:hypothetical protein
MGSRDNHRAGTQLVPRGEGNEDQQLFEESVDDEAHVFYSKHEECRIRPARISRA